MLAFATLIVTFASALAAGVDGALVVEVGPDTEVQQYRVVKPGRSQLMIQGCEADLAKLLDDRTTRGILELDVIGVGRRSWYVQVQLADVDRELVAVVEDGSLTLSTRPKTARDLYLGLTDVSIEELFAGENLPSAAEPPPIPLSFLRGRALLPAVDPHSYEPLLPVYAPGIGPGSWWAIDEARETYLESSSPTERARALYALGWNYLELGFNREAQYYFEQLPLYDQVLDPQVTAMTRARVAIILGDWQQAREQLVAGFEADASPEQVLESLALISLATGDPPATATAHALLGSSGRPEAWLLAAELLQQDHHFAQSIGVLQGLESRVPPEMRPWVSLRLGDALLATEDYDGASRAYGHAPEELAELRRLHTQLLTKPSNTWPSVIPAMRGFASGAGPRAAEALYLLAQVNILFGETTSAMEDLKELEERFPDSFGRSDAGELQLELYFESLESLHEQLRWLDIATMHRRTWSRKLLDRTSEYKPLLNVADAFEAMGLPEEARHVLGDAFYVLSTRNGEDPALVFRLARLYADAGRFPEALETLDYLERHKLPAAYAGQRALLRGRILEATGEDQAALAAYRTAAVISNTRDEAQIRLALRDAEAGRCGDAIPSLERLLMPARKLERVTDPLPLLALARCLMMEGREADAAKVAREAAGRIESPGDARHAGYIGATATDDDAATSDLSRRALLSQRDIWALLGQEDLEAAAFEAKVNARRSE